MKEFCYAAKVGKVCIDDLCRGNPDNTLCGFDQSEYDDIARCFSDEDEPYYQDDDQEE